MLKSSDRISLMPTRQTRAISLAFYSILFLSMFGNCVYGTEIDVGTFSVKPSIAIFIDSGDGQYQPPGETLAAPFVVIVKDAAGNAIEGVNVNFSISLSPPSATGQSLSNDTSILTDFQGKASTTLTLGNQLGDYKVDAEIDFSDEASFADKSYVEGRFDSWEVSFVASSCTDKDDGDNDGFSCNDCMAGNSAYTDQCCSSTEAGRIVYRSVAQQANCITEINGGVVGPGCYPDSNCDGIPDICDSSSYPTRVWLTKEPYKYYCINKPNVNIDSPTSNAKYVYDTESPGILSIPVSSTPSGDYNLATINWDMTAISGSNRTSAPTDWWSGSFVFSGLPSMNSSFGNHIISASYKIGQGSPYVITDNVSIMVYYSAHANNNPIQTNQNWFYYWSQALGYNNLVYGLPSTCTDTNSACVIISSSTSWTIYIGSGAYWPPPGNPPTGNIYINGLRASIYHEEGHIEHITHNSNVHDKWNSILDEEEDIDRDNICDREPIDMPGHDGGLEAKYGLSPFTPNDEEAIPNYFEQIGVYGYETYDWANPGSQWPVQSP